jgi:hypothetical protein
MRAGEYFADATIFAGYVALAAIGLLLVAMIWERCTRGFREHSNIIDRIKIEGPFFSGGPVNPEREKTDAEALSVHNQHAEYCTCAGSKSGHDDGCRLSAPRAQGGGVNEESIRADERARIARHMRAVANNAIHDNESDGVDGYMGGVLLELADVIERNGEDKA